MTNLRLPPAGQPPRRGRNEVLDRLSEADVQAIYRALGVNSFKPGGPNNWKVFVPWRENVHDEAMTIRRSDGVWQDHALDEGGSIFDAILRAGRAPDIGSAIEWVAEHSGMPGPAPAATLLGVSTYVYTDVTGQPLYRVMREDFISATGERRKSIRQHTLVDAVWEVAHGPADSQKVLYNLPRIADPANQHAPVVLVEGETCAEAATALGVVGTCVVGGTSGWLGRYAPALAGRDVVILPDNDDPGWKFAGIAAESLVKTARSLKVISLPDLGPRRETGGKDIVDWIADGHGLAELLALLADAEPYRPKAMLVSLWEVYQNPPPRPAQLVTMVWEPETFGMIAAHPKSYKGFFVIDLMASLASGRDFLGHPDFSIPAPIRVVYWFEEGTAWDVLRRITRWCKARNVEPGDWMERVRLVFGQGLRLADEAGMRQLRAEIEVFGPQLVICDTLSRAAGGLDENNSQDMGFIVDALDAIKRDYSTATVYVHHRNKGGGYRGHSSLYAACDCIASLERPEESNRLIVDFELKSGHQAERIELELLDDASRDGALFMLRAAVGPKLVKGVAPPPGVACRYIHEHGVNGWIGDQRFRDVYGLTRNASAWKEFKAEMCNLGLWAEREMQLGMGRPFEGVILTQRGLELIGILDDD